MADVWILVIMLVLAAGNAGFAVVWCLRQAWIHMAVSVAAFLMLVASAAWLVSQYMVPG